VLREGGYIDAEAQNIQVELLLYNSALRCFIIVRIAMDQSDVGTFEAQVTVQAVNTAWPLTTVQGVKTLLLPAFSGALATIVAIDAVVMVARRMLMVRVVWGVSYFHIMPMLRNLPTLHCLQVVLLRLLCVVSIL
jgi:hypothetical protein